MRVPRTIVAVLAFVGAASCGTIGDAQAPHVSLADVRFLDGGLLEQRLLVDLRIGNPNNFDLPLEGMTFELELNDQTFATGFSNQPFTVPRLGEVRVPIVASTTLLDVVQQALALGRRTDLSYRLAGVAYMQGLAGRTLSYERSGRLRLLPETGAGPGGRLVPL